MKRQEENLIDKKKITALCRKCKPKKFILKVIEISVLISHLKKWHELDTIEEYKNYTMRIVQSENSVSWKKKHISKIIYVLSMILIK